MSKIELPKDFHKPRWDMNTAIPAWCSLNTAFIFTNLIFIHSCLNLVIGTADSALLSFVSLLRMVYIWGDGQGFRRGMKTSSAIWNRALHSRPDEVGGLRIRTWREPPK